MLSSLRGLHEISWPVLKYNNILLWISSATVIHQLCLSLINNQMVVFVFNNRIIHYEVGDPWHLSLPLSLFDWRFGRCMRRAGCWRRVLCEVSEWRPMVSSRCKRTWPLTCSASILDRCQTSDKRWSWGVRCRHLPLGWEGKWHLNKSKRDFENVLSEMTNKSFWIRFGLTSGRH